MRESGGQIEQYGEDTSEKLTSSKHGFNNIRHGTLERVLNSSGVYLLGNSTGRRRLGQIDRLFDWLKRTLDIRNFAWDGS